MTQFEPGDKVMGANDRSRDPKVGTVVRTRTKTIKTVNEGVVEQKEIVVVRTMVPSGESEVPTESELPAEALRLAPSGQGAQDGASDPKDDAQGE